MACNNFVVKSLLQNSNDKNMGRYQAARALANLAAHGDSNGNNAAVGQEPGALEALVRLTSSQSEGVR